MLRHDEPRGANAPATTTQPRRHHTASGHVALLAATALGFAYAPTGDDDTQARRLASFADPHPETLTRAQAAVLTLEIGCAQARTQAAALLRRAAQHVVDPCGVGRRSDREPNLPTASEKKGRL